MLSTITVLISSFARVAILVIALITPTLLQFLLPIVEIFRSLVANDYFVTITKLSGHGRVLGVLYPTKSTSTDDAEKPSYTEDCHEQSLEPVSFFQLLSMI